MAPCRAGSLPPRASGRAGVGTLGEREGFHSRACRKTDPVLGKHEKVVVVLDSGRGLVRSAANVWGKGDAILDSRSGKSPLPTEPRFPTACAACGSGEDQGWVV